MKIALASDHAAFDLKAQLVAWLREEGHEVADLGTDDPIPYEPAQFCDLSEVHDDPNACGCHDCQAFVSWARAHFTQEAITEAQARIKQAEVAIAAADFDLWRIENGWPLT